MIKENEVYISTGGFNLPGYQFLEKYKNQKINIELSGGKFHEKNDTKIIKLRKIILNTGCIIIFHHQKIHLY